MENNKSDKTFLELLYYLRGKIAIILVVVIATTLLSFLISKFAITPEYTATSSIYVLNRSSDDKINNSDFQTSTELLNDYKVLIKGKSVTSEVINELDLDMTPGALSKKIEVTSEKGTRVLLIQVTDINPEQATEIANTVWKVAAVQLKNIMDVDAVNLVYEASVPKSPSAPNTTMNTIMGFLIGLVLVVLVLSCIFMLDNRIKKEEDVEYHLGLTTLGTIPYYEDLDKNKKNKLKMLNKFKK